MARFITAVLVALAALLPAISAARRPSAPIPPEQLITSPLSCLSDLECPTDSFCRAPSSEPQDFFFGFGAPDASTCAPRLPEGSNCTMVGTVECEQGTFCGFIDDFNPTPLTCLRQGPEGAPCALTATAPCEGDLVCEMEPTCRRFTFGFAGDACQFDRQCQQKRGFFCRANMGQCAPKRPPGGVCELESNNFECDGFCVSSTRPFEKPGVCQRLQRAGERCNDDRQCRTNVLFFRDTRTPDLLCNRPTGPTGVCVLETDLLRELGAPCNPERDACDARRGLSCGTVRREFKCVQRAAAPNAFNHFCTPDSPLSSCPPDSRGNLRECRRALSLSKQFQGTFACRTRRQTVPLGNPCDIEFAICQAGAVCAEAPGVVSPTGRFPPPPLHTCMKVLPVGAPCVDTFRFKCEEGSFCVDGSCQRVNTAPTVPVTFTSVGGDCSELSCPPGTVCVGNPDVPEVSKTCRFPVREAGLWQPCADAAQFELRCKEDLTCALNYLGEGVRLCRPKRGIGGICEDDESCIGDLKCDPSFRPKPFQRRCFDPSLSLNIGDSCNAFPRPDEPRCVAKVEMDASLQFIRNVFSLACLPKNGANICQRAVGLFEQCSAEENVACASGDLVCNQFNVCVPRSQM